MRTVWIVEEKKEDSLGWFQIMYLGIFNYETDANKTMNRHVSRLQINEMRKIPDIRSPKRGEGKVHFNNTLQEIAEIPSNFRIRRYGVE